MEGEGNSGKVFVLEKGRETGNEGELEGFATNPCLPKSVCFSVVRSRGPSHSSQKPSGEAMGLSSGPGRLLKQLVLILLSPSCWLST